jgi:hypothetical protein
LAERLSRFENKGEFSYIEAANINKRAGPALRRERHGPSKRIAELAQSHRTVWRRQRQFGYKSSPRHLRH